MVAIFTGTGLGFERGSAFVLGGRGQVGQAQLGQAGQDVMVNATTGNLVMSKQDEILIGRGADATYTVTYNGLASDAGKWGMSPYRMIGAVTGTVETAGSTVSRSNWDGHSETYVWEGGRYVCKEGGGAFDELRRSIVDGQVVWTWTDGNSRISEVYTLHGGIHVIDKVIDSDGNIQTWTYNSGATLQRITNANGDYTQYSWQLGRISQLTTSYTPSAGGSASLTRVRYGWDSLNRLLTVTVDLTPSDNAITDGNTYVTTYGYDGTSRRVKSIAQTDGSLIEVEYDGSARVSRLVQTAATGVTRATDFAYSAGYTEVTDDQGGVTKLTYNVKGELTQLTMPAALLNGPVQTFNYEYDPLTGDVTKVIEAAGETVYTYDTNGNQTKVRDPLGNIVERVFDSTNHLLKETIFLVADSDGDGVATIPRTTRYIYNSLGHLRYVVTASGRVTRHGYNAYGWLGTTIEYRGRHYDLTGTTPATDLTLANLEAWAGPDATTDRSLEKWTSRLYDARGNLQTVWTLGLMNPNGTVSAVDNTVLNYVYDQAGNLLFKQQGNQPTESFLYDGLGRLKASTDANANSTSIVFNDSANSTVVTLASGLTRTSVYNRAGELISFAESNATTTATTSYSYDSLGRLRIVTDPTGLKTHYLYDRAGRKVAEIGHDGSITQYSYNGDNLLVRTLRHGGKLNTDQLNSLISGGAPANVTLSSVTPSPHADDRYEWNIYDTANRLIQTIDGTGATTIFSYDGASRLYMTTAYFAPIAEASVTSFKTNSPTGYVTPSADSAVDRNFRYFYDSDGLLIATLDAEGALTEHFYDDAGLHWKTLRYFNPTENLDRLTRNLTQLRASLAIDNDRDIHTYSLFDDRGVLRATIDGEGNLTRYRYQNLSGLLDQEVRGQKLDPAAVRTSPPRWNTLPAGVAAELETIDYLRNGAGDVTAMTRTLRGGAADSTTYSYDSVGNMVSSTIQGVGANDARTLQRRYDKFGRLIGELPGEGSAALADLTNPNTEAVDAVYLTWGTTYSYDLAGRLVSSTRPNGTNASANRTLFYYDEKHRLRFEINPKGEVAEYRYNALGERTETISYGTRIGTTTLAGMSGGLATQAMIALVTADALIDSRSSIEYYVNGTVKLTRDALLRTTSYIHNSFREMTGRTDPVSDTVGISSVLAYDRRGLLTSETRNSGADQLQLLTSFNYDSFGRQISVTDPELRLRGTGYDRAGRVVRRTDATGAWQAFSYDPLGNVHTSTDRNGKTTTYGYTNRTMTVTTPENVVTTTVRNAHGETLSITASNRTVTYAYDKSGNLKSVTDAAGQQLKNYDKAGRLLEDIDARGVKTSYEYDAAARLLTRTVDVGLTAEGHLNLVTSYEYDAKGRQVKIIDPSLMATRIEFDLNGRKTAMIVNDGGLNLKTAYAYDHGGRVLTITEGAGTAAARTTKYDYDTAGRVMDSWVDPNGLNLRTHFLYDKNGNVINVMDAAGNVTVYTYDDENRQVLASDAEGRLTRTSYDAEGRIVATRRYAATAILETNGTNYGIWKYEFDFVPGQDDSVDEVISYVYDKDGRLRFSIDALGHPCRYDYDGSGSLLAKVEFAGTIAYVPADTVLTVQGKIDAASPALAARTSRSYYDTAGRRTLSVDAAGGVTAYSYDSSSNAVKQTLYNEAYGGTDFSLNVIESWASTQLADARITRTVYDGAGRMVYQADQIATASYVTEYQYDGAGRVSKQIRYAAAYTVADGATQADLKALLPTSIPDTAAVTAYGYDGAGRLTDTTDAENSCTHLVLDATGLVTDTITASNVSAEASATHRVFDKGGRVITETRAFGSSAESTTHYVYDGVGRAIDTTFAYGTADASTTHRVFDAAGRVESETRGHGTAEASTINYDWNALGRLATETDGRNHTIVRNYDRAGRLLSETVPIDASTGAETVRYYDSFGNVVKIRDPRGNYGYFYYDGLSRLTLQVDPEGYATKTTYTAAGAVSSVTRYATKVGGTWSETMAPIPATDTLEDATTVFTLDRLGRLTAIKNAENFTESYGLDAFGNRLSVTREIDRTTNPITTAIINYTYDRMGRVISEQLPVGSTRADGSVQSTSVTNTFEYDARGNRTMTIEAFGLEEARTTNFVYDKADRLIEKRGDPVQVVAQDLATVSTITPTDYYYYDRRGNLIETKDASGARTLSYYDRLDRATAELSAVGTFSVFEYDDNGNVEKSRLYATALTLPASPGGNAPAAPGGESRETIHVYDRANRLTSTSVADVRSGAWTGSAYASTIATVTTVFGYDQNGNVTTETDANGNITYTYYDKLNRRTAHVDRENYLTAWTLDGDGNATYERRYQTRFIGTPGLAPPSVENHADDRVTDFTYDRNGRRLTEVRGAVATQGIDAVTGAATAATVATTIRYAYDGLGLVISKIEANDDTTLFEYDKIGRLIRTTAPQFTDHGGTPVLPTAENFHDGLGNVVRTEVNKSGGAAADDRVTRYNYGAGGRLASTIDTAGFTRTYGYDAAGRVVKEGYVRLTSNAAEVHEAIAYRYDAAGRVVTQFMATLSGNWTFGEATRIRYNAYGEVTGKGMTGGPNDAVVYQEVMDYDGGGRLWRSTSGDGTSRFHIYDKAGNETLTLASAGADLSALTVENYASSITTAGDTSIADAVTTVMIYDKRGQSTGTREPDRQLSAGATAVIVRARTYNAFGEVASETEPRGFDASGSPITFSNGAGYTTHFTYNAMGRLLSRVSPQVSVTAETGLASSVNPTEHYGYDKSGRLVSIDDANGNRITRLLLAGSGHGESEALVTREFHPDDGVRKTGYDVFGDVRTSTDEIDRVTSYSYDKMGRLTQLAHAGGLLTDYYVYDALGQRTQHWNSQFGSTSKERTDYDGQGRVVSSIDYLGGATTYAYAWSGTLTTTDFGTFGGWVKSSVHISGRTASETVDYFGRTVARTDFGGHTFTFAFDDAGRLATQGNSLGQNLVYSYYNIGRISQILDGIAAGANKQARYGYDAAGNRLTESYGSYSGNTLLTSHQNATATWDAVGRMKTFADTGAGGAHPATVSYDYDAVGNIRRIHETWNDVPFNTERERDHWYKYDKMNRFTVAEGILLNGSIVRGAGGGADICYNAAGERRAVTCDAGLQAQVEAFIFDDPQQLQVPDPPHNGHYETVTAYYLGERKETYTYRGDGQLMITEFQETGYTDNGDGTVAPDGILGEKEVRAEYVRDALGRATSYTEYRQGGPSMGATYSRTAEYDARSNVTSDQVSSLQANGYTTNVTNSTNTYTSGGVYQGGALVRSTTTGMIGSTAVPATSTDNVYVWWDDARLSVSTFDSNTGSSSNATWPTTYTYDNGGRLTQARIADGTPRTVAFVTDLAGQVMSRINTNDNQNVGPQNYIYYFDGLQVGEVGSNDTMNVDYATAMKRRSWAPGTNGFQFGSGSVPFADLDTGFEHINGSSESPAAGRYVVRDGESLQGIAQAVWGDAAMWYLIAEANGLAGGQSPAAGTSLIIPNKITNIHNNSETFRVYDPNKALGDLSPTQPKPVKKPGGCGMLGQIILVAIAVAVTIVSHGALTGVFGTVLGSAIGAAAGSVVSQTVGVATGLQDKFDWKGVALAALSGAVGGGIGKLGSLAKAGRLAGGLGKVGKFLTADKLLSNVVKGVVSSAATQGIAVATGLQKKFDWVGVGVAGVVSGVAGEISRNLPDHAVEAVRATTTTPEVLARAASQGNLFVSGLAGAFAGATVRSVATGTSFGDNLLAVLPDVIGSTIGNMIVDGLKSERPGKDISSGKAAADASTKNIAATDGSQPDGRIQLASAGPLPAGLLAATAIPLPSRVTPLPGGGIRIGNAIYTAVQVLEMIHDSAERGQVDHAIEKFGLNAADATHVWAARAYVWGTYNLPARIWDVGWTGPTNEAASQGLMRITLVDPGIFIRGLYGSSRDQNIMYTVAAAEAGNALPGARDRARPRDVEPVLQTTSRAARGAVAQQLGRRGNWQVHHLIPAEVWGVFAPLTRLAQRQGWHQDSESNLIVLPADPATQVASGNLPIHNGSHPRYNANVAASVGRYVTRLNNRVSPYQARGIYDLVAAQQRIAIVGRLWNPRVH